MWCFAGLNAPSERRPYLQGREWHLGHVFASSALASQGDVFTREVFDGHSILRGEGQAAAG